MHILATRLDYIQNFALFTFLRDHKNSVHNGIQKIREKTYSCDLCDEKFELPSQMKKHINLVHNGIYDIQGI